jgi:hypothetical protein
MTEPTQTTRWDKPRLGVIVWADAILSMAVLTFCYQSGRLIWWLALHLRRFIPPEFAHHASLILLRWQHPDLSILRFIERSGGNE